jgi:hypothetical protein
MERVRIQWRYDGEIVPALQDGSVVAWDYHDELVPGAVGRSYLLLEHGVKFSIPPIWTKRKDPIWYVDLAIVTREDDLYRVLDLDIDVFVPTDGRPYRMLDLDELADAIESGEFTLEEAMDGLRRWQRFLDTYLHCFDRIDPATGPRPDHRDVRPGWRDFPPAAIASLASLPEGAFNR